MKKICIVTTDFILGYQPTILNLYDNLIKNFNVEIISFAPRYISSKKVDDKNVIYLKEDRLRHQVLEGLDLCIGITGKYTKWRWTRRYGNNYFQRKLISRTLKNCLFKVVADEFIVVDFLALYTFQKAKPAAKCHFLSLEIFEKDRHRDMCDFKRIISVIIQTRDRYNYLFGTMDMKTFFIQNAPNSVTFYFNSIKTKSLLWAGTTLLKFGVLHCIEFIKLNKNYILTLKGGVQKKTLKVIQKKYQQLIDSEKLILDTSYLDDKGFIEFLSQFTIGFCFYDIELVKNNFNYRTAPSGKLFAYYAASVPVIALDIPGLQSVREFNAGVLIEDYSYTSIFNAIEKINSNYEYYFEGCKRAANFFAFDKHCKVFIDFLSVKMSQVPDE